MDPDSPDWYLPTTGLSDYRRIVSRSQTDKHFLVSVPGYSVPPELHSHSGQYNQVLLTRLESGTRKPSPQGNRLLDGDPGRSQQSGDRRAAIAGWDRTVMI